MTRFGRPALFLLCFMVAACDTRPDVFVAPNGPTAGVDMQRIYLATGRVLAEDLSGTTE